MKKLLSITLVLALVCCSMLAFSGCNSGKSSGGGTVNYSAKAESFAESYISTMVRLTYDVSTASASGTASSRGANEWYVRGTVYATGYNGLKYSGSFSATVEYDENDDSFDVVDYDIGDLYRNF